MGRLIFELSDAEREALEAIRKSWGLRSHAETLRQLISAEVARPLVERPLVAAGNAAFVEAYTRIARRKGSELSDDAKKIAIDAARASWRPHPKPGKAK